MKTTLHVVSERVSRLLILEALTAPGGGVGQRCRLAASVLAALVALGVAITPSTTYAGCGGEGERACCCFGDGRCCDVTNIFCNFERACDGGLEEVFIPPCNVDGAPGCGSCSISWCADIKPCGGEGQRACCASDGGPLDPPCDNGLIQVGSCRSQLGTENCVCGGGGLSDGVCKDPECGEEGERACSPDTRCTGHPLACEAGVPAVAVASLRWARHPRRDRADGEVISPSLRGPVWLSRQFWGSQPSPRCAFSAWPGRGTGG